MCAVPSREPFLERGWSESQDWSRNPWLTRRKDCSKYPWPVHSAGHKGHFYTPRPDCSTRGQECSSWTNPGAWREDWRSKPWCQDRRSNPWANPCTWREERRSNPRCQDWCGNPWPDIGTRRQECSRDPRADPAHSCRQERRSHAWPAAEPRRP